MEAVFISSPACGRLVHPSTAQPRGSKIASSNGLAGTDIDLRFAGRRKTTISLFPFFGAAFFFVFWPPNKVLITIGLIPLYLISSNEIG